MQYLLLAMSTASMTQEPLHKLRAKEVSYKWQTLHQTYFLDFVVYSAAFLKDPPRAPISLLGKLFETAK